MNKLKIHIIQISIIVIFLLTWELLSYFNIINSFFFSSPSRIIKELTILLQNKLLFNNIIVTLKEIIISLILGLGIAFIISLLMYSFKTFRKIIDPYLTIINSMPKVALGPIIIILIGANNNAIIVMALLINVIVATISLYTGFSSVNKYHLLLFKSLHASKIKTITNLVIPSSIKSIIGSLKITLSMSLVGVIMGEFLTSKEGIGYLIIYGTQIFNLDLVYTGIFLIIILAIILYLPVVLLEKKIKY